MLSRKKQINVKRSNTSAVESSRTPPVQQTSHVTPTNGQSFLPRKAAHASSSAKPVDAKSAAEVQVTGNIKINATQSGKSGTVESDFPHQQELKVLDGIITNFRNVIINDNDKQRQRELKKLTAALSNWDSVEDSVLAKLVKELQKNIDSIDEKFNPLLQQILLGNWYERSSTLVTQIETFISELIVSRPGFAGTAITNFVSKFCPTQTSSYNNVVDAISPVEEKVFRICHQNLQRIFTSFPTKEDNGVKSIGHAYPYMGKSPHIHYCYVRNLLKSLEYMPQVRGQLLHVLIHKLARIDVNISREAVQALADQERSPRRLKREDGDYEMFEMDLDGSYNPGTEENNPLIETLDVCLNMTFEYVESIFKGQSAAEDCGAHDDDGASGENRWTREGEIERMFSWFLQIFETEILPCFGVNNVQFLYFYILSLHPSFLSRFLDFLWKKATNLNTSPVIRIQTMAYLSGILARANYVSIKTVKTWLTKLCDWANNYASQRSKSAHWATVNIQAHGPFYAVCQTIFYVFAFRNKELITSRKRGAFTRALDLGRLLTSELNPLKACQEEIGYTFVEAAHQHQISYCGTVLERNQVARIPTISQEAVGAHSDTLVSTQLEAFFPFDPFLLPRSKRWIEGIHSNYEPYCGEIKAGKKIKAPPDEDSIEMELGSYNDGGRSLKSHPFFPAKCKTEVDVGFID